MFRNVVSFLGLCLLFLSTALVNAEDDQVGQRASIDILLHGGHIITLDDEMSEVEAIAISGNRIVKVGRSQDLLRLITEETRAIDLKGATVIPGINDSHIHTLDLGKSLNNIALTGLNLGQVEKALTKKVAETEPGKAIFGNGWTLEALGQKPTRAFLDQLSPDHPVMFHDMSHHATWMNSLALDQLGLSGSDQQLPVGVIVERNGVTGEPSGVVHEVWELIELAQFRSSKEETKAAIVNAVKLLNEKGITGFTEPGMSAEKAEIYEELEREGKLTARVNIHLVGGRSVEAIQQAMSAYQGDATQQGTQAGLVTVRGVKLFLDGAPPGLTAATFDDYACCEGVRGILTFKGNTEEEQGEEILRAIRWLHQNGYQMGIHATGDRSAFLAIEGLIQAMSADKKQTEDGSKNPLRHYLIHGDRVQDEDISRMADWGIGLSTNPIISYMAGSGLRQLWGDHHGGRHMASKLFLDQDIWTSFGTDAPVTQPEWKKNIEYAVSRIGVDGVVNGPEFRITLLEALLAHTKTAAYQNFQEREKGTIEAGRLADLTVLNKNILTVMPEQINDIKTLMTIVDGKIVFDHL